MEGPLEVWASEVPESSEIGLHLAVLEATRRAYAICSTSFPGYRVLNHIVGQNRFTALQCDLLAFGKTDPVFKSEELFHINGLPFTRLITPRLHVTTANVESENAHPQMSFFREQEQERQLAFLKGADVLVAHLTVHVEGVDLSIPTSIRIHFPDGSGGYMDDFIDLKAKRLAPSVLPVEKVHDQRETPSRREKSQSDRSNDRA